MAMTVNTLNLKAQKSRPIYLNYLNTKMFSWDIESFTLPDNSIQAFMCGITNYKMKYDEKSVKLNKDLKLQIKALKDHIKIL